MTDVSEVTLKLRGVEQEFSFVHWTDIHLSECDQRNETVVEKMVQRANSFGGDPTSTAGEMVRTLNDLKPELVAITGDFLDAPTQKNIEIGKELLESLDAPNCIAIGNHEWGFLVEPMDRDYWSAKLRFMTEQPLDWHVQHMHGVNLLFVDDSNYQITADQLQKTQQLLEDGRSCILFMHIPLAIDSLVPRTVEVWNTPILLGAENISPDKRKRWRMGENIEPSTAEFCNLIKSHPNVKAIFSGHLHFSHEDEYQPGASQYVTDAGFKKRYRRVRVIP